MANPLNEQMAEVLTIYAESVNEKLREVTTDAMKKLVKETRATAPVGRRKGQYKKHITADYSGTRKSARGIRGQNVHAVWYVKAPDYSFAGGAFTSIQNNVATYMYWAVPTTLASSIPNTNNGTLTIQCVTKNGSTVIGTKTVLLTVKVPASVVPTISSVTHAEADSTVISAAIGAYVQGKSTAKVTVTATGASGSTIKSISSTVLGMADGGARLVTSMPLNDYHAVPKKYVVEKVASIKSELEMLGIFYTVLKNAENTPYIKIPTGSMTTAYIESADFDAFHTNGNLVYSGTIDSLEFMDESFATIPNSLISFTAPTYFQVPQGAKWIYLHCGEKVPGDVEWDAGPLVYNGAIYFQVKKG